MNEATMAISDIILRGRHCDADSPAIAAAIYAEIQSGNLPGLALKTYDGTTCWTCDKCGKVRTGRGCMRCLEDAVVTLTAERDAARSEFSDMETRNAARDARTYAGDGTDSLGLLFQNGPINEAGVNGITHEALLAILIDRLRGFQAGPFKSKANACALTHLEEALMWLNQRTLERMRRGVEGTHKV